MRILASILLAALSLTACRSVPPILDPSLGAGLEADVRAADVVHAGELHDRRAHHEFQADLLRVMIDQAKRDGGKTLFLGMEMFQRPFQGVLDDYVLRRIDEHEMLMRTEWFARWRFDYTLYAPLWRLCREHGVRIVALNAERGIVRQIGRQGLASLSAEQRAEVAEEIDLDVPSHRKRILGVFQGGAHQMPEERLASLYQAQTTWDETMAESAARVLGGPGARMLVVAGSMHIQERDGIPDRLKRRVPGIDDLLVILRTAGEERDEAPDHVLGDHVVTLPRSTAPPRARLGVVIEETEHALYVKEVVPGGAADRAGVQAGDVLMAVGGHLVTTMTDLRYRLDPIAPGTTLTLAYAHGMRTVEAQVTIGDAAHVE